MKINVSTEMKKQHVVQVGLGIGTADLIGEAETAFTTVQDPKVNYRCQPIYLILHFYLILRLTSVCRPH